MFAREMKRASQERLAAPKFSTNSEGFLPWQISMTLQVCIGDQGVRTIRSLMHRCQAMEIQIHCNRAFDNPAEKIR